MRGENPKYIVAGMMVEMQTRGCNPCPATILMHEGEGGHAPVTDGLGAQASCSKRPQKRSLNILRVDNTGVALVFGPTGVAACLLASRQRTSLETVVRGDIFR